MTNHFSPKPWAVFFHRIWLCLIASAIGLWLPAAATAVTDTCPPFFLKTDQGDIINPITGENTDQPFSPRKTCGACHDVDTIAKGYHFMMDWDKADDERFRDTETPWQVSTGLTGGMITYGFFQLARKRNTHPDEIDLTAFDFVARTPEPFKGFQKPGCAGCHPGGGMLEVDRDGFRYDLRLAENPELADTLDGDYYQSQWDRTGVIEPDCFFCHGNRYQIQVRIAQIKDLNFKWAGTAAAGLGRVYGKVSEGETPRVVYNKRLFNEDGAFYMPDMVFRPEPKNCLLCHESIDLGKRGNSWADPLNPDVHHLAGLTCVDCHPGDISHNFAKGNATDGRVADELDNTMRSCRDCHTQGHMGATRMRHKGIRPDHLDKLSCEACHIPELHRSAVAAMYLNTGIFGKHARPGTRGFGDPKPWKPAYVIRAKDKDGIPRITPVNPMLNTLFTNRQDNGVHVPLFLSEVETAYKECENDLSRRDPSYDFHRKEDIRRMLQTLTRTLSFNQRITRPNPYFHTGGHMYSLLGDGSLNQSPDTTWVQRLPFYSISHNVAPADKALGAGGCRDCHSKTAHLFNGPVVTDYFGNNGNPVTVSMSEFLGLPASTRLWNTWFGAYLSAGSFFLPAALILSAVLGAPALFKARPGLSIIISLTAFSTAHVWIIAHTGMAAGIRQTLDAAFPILAPFLMLAVGAAFFRQLRKRACSGKPARGLFIMGTLTAASGILLWIRWPVDVRAMLLVSVVHVIFAAILAGLMIRECLKDK